LRGTETFGRLIGAAAAHVLESGRSLLLVQNLLDMSRRRPPMDGCIVAYPYGNDEVLTYLMTHHVPTVTINADPDRPDLPWVVHTDYVAPIQAILERFHGNGARRIVLISGTEENAWNRQTSAAYLAWLAARNLPANRITLYEGEAREGARRVLTDLFASATPPDAVIVAASTFAAGALEAIRSRGLRVPEHVFLAALTDSEYTRNASPGITALDLRLEDLAGQAVRLLRQRLEGVTPEAWPSVTPTINWRVSSG
jgi:DNA-binding LacI/PurR family transcriptional regulator